MIKNFPVFSAVPVFSVGDADYYPLPGTDRLTVRASRLQRLYLALWDRFEAVSKAEEYEPLQAARLLSLCHRVYWRYSSVCANLIANQVWDKADY
jgi:hypothetical protein